MPAAMMETLDSSAPLGLGRKFARFVIIGGEPFTPRNLERWGASWLREHHYEVRLVDVSLLARAPQVTRLVEEATSGPGVVRPASLEALESVLRQCGAGALLMLYVDPGDRLRPLFDMARKHGAAILYFDRGRLPRRAPRFPRVRRMVGRASSLCGWPRRAQGAAPTNVELDYFVVGGTEPRANPPAWLGRASTIVPACAYDFVLWQSAQPFAYGQPYAVFLDQAYPEHTDSVILQVGNPLESEVYYPEIEDFLEAASETLRMPVLVALHPRAARTDRATPYRRLPSFAGRTASLVKGASVVIAHDSAAISFAILGRKPLLLVKLDQVERSRWLCRNLIDELARVLGAPIVRVESRNLPALDTLSVDEPKYASYEARYIRHPSIRSDGDVWSHLFGSDETR
jgi:hypothetical protein